MVLLFALLLYRVNRQREMEAEIARLKQEQAGDHRAGLPGAAAHLWGQRETVS